MKVKKGFNFLVKSLSSNFFAYHLRAFHLLLVGNPWTSAFIVLVEYIFYVGEFSLNIKC